jgi:uncharacterized protein YraI
MLRRTALWFCVASAFAATTPALAQQQQTPQARATINLNARSGPGTGYSVLLTIPANSVVTVLRCTQAYAWCEVRYANQTGWSAGQYLQSVQTNQPITAAGGQLDIALLEFLVGALGERLGIPAPVPPAPAPPVPGASEVCFYTDANFAGQAFCVNSGASNTNLTAQWNDTISSIRVGADASVQVCGDTGYRGWCQIYLDDVNLTGSRNDSISSYRTILPIAQPPQPAPQPIPAPSPAYQFQARATVSLNARAGSGTQHPIRFVVPQNGVIDIRQCLVGYSWCEINYFGQIGWSAGQYLLSLNNNRLISETGGQLGIPTVGQAPPLQPPAVFTPVSNEVCFFRDPNFGGDAFCIPTGHINTSMSGQWNNSVSSIRVGSGAQVTVCGDTNLTGWCQTYVDDVTLTSFRNDSISSYRASVLNAASPAARVCFFEHTFFNGASFCIGAGQSYSLLPAGWDNRISSIRVEPGYSVQVCRDASFGGWCEYLTADVPQLLGDRNEAISSVRTQ